MMDRKLIHRGRMQTAFIAALVMLLVTAAMTLLLHQPAEAQSNSKAVSNVSLSSPNPGEIAISWGRAQRRPRRLPGHLEEVQRQMAFL